MSSLLLLCFYSPLSSPARLAGDRIDSSCVDVQGPKPGKFCVLIFCRASAPVATSKHVLQLGSDTFFLHTLLHYYNYIITLVLQETIPSLPYGFTLHPPFSHESINSIRMIRSLRSLRSRAASFATASVSGRHPQSVSMHHLASGTTSSIVSSNLPLRPSLHKVAIRTVFIQTENTPNPESIKFVPTNTVRSV